MFISTCLSRASSLPSVESELPSKGSLTHLQIQGMAVALDSKRARGHACHAELWINKFINDVLKLVRVFKGIPLFLYSCFQWHIQSLGKKDHA